jgi:hypothetical protein
MAYNLSNITGYNITGANQMYRPQEPRNQIPFSQPQQPAAPVRKSAPGLQVDRKEGSYSPLKTAPPPPPPAEAQPQPVVKRQDKYQMQ